MTERECIERCKIILRRLDKMIVGYKRKKIDYERFGLFIDKCKHRIYGLTESFKGNEHICELKCCVMLCLGSLNKDKISGKHYGWYWEHAKEGIRWNTMKRS